MFVIRQRVLHLATPGEPFIERLEEHLGVAEAVGDALRCDWIFVIAGIADERPPGAIGFAKKVWDEAGSGKTLFAPAAIEAFRQFGNGFPDLAHEFSFNV